MIQQPPTVTELSRDAYLSFAETQQHVVVANPICQECKSRPSVQINHWGPIKAMCNECLDEEQQRFDQHVREQAEYDRKYESGLL